jgi:hypothetical protein
MERYDWTDSHGSFQDLVGLADERLWAEKCNTYLAELDNMLPPDSVDIEKDDRSEIASTADSEQTDVEGGVADCSEKRKATVQLIEQLTVPSKRKCNEQKQPDDMQACVENCRIGK